MLGQRWRYIACIGDYGKKANAFPCRWSKAQTHLPENGNEKRLMPKETELDMASFPEAAGRVSALVYPQL
jgi:hypothetical protein